MINDIYRRWMPIEHIPPELYLDDIVDNHEGLELVLRGENDEKSLCFRFGLFVLAYQVTQETCVLKKLDENPVLNGPWPLYITDNSRYIQYLTDQSYGIENGKSFHYVIKHADGLIEIVSRKQPEVKWSVS